MLGLLRSLLVGIHQPFGVATRPRQQPRKQEEDVAALDQDEPLLRLDAAVR